MSTQAPLRLPAADGETEMAALGLEMDRELTLAARHMLSRPGHTKNALVAIAQRLGSASPHVLPRYWQECARRFAAAGNRAYAAQCFEKAREAEREYQLQVSESERAEAFLEFALAGAVAAKSLSAYAKALLASPDKQQAFSAFEHLCVRRTLGGLPPWMGMAKQLRSLALAAKLDADAMELGFLAQVLHAPALARAPAEVWKAWQAPLQRLCAQHRAMVQHLLDLWPRPQNVLDESAFAEHWSKLLTRCGGAEWLLQTPRGKPAAWLGKLLRWPEDHPKFVCDWLRALAPRLVADGVPLTLEVTDDDRWPGELDARFAELSLVLAVPLDRLAGLSLTLWPWALDADRAEELPLTAAHPQLGPLLIKALDGVIGDDDFENAARGKVSLRVGRAAWLAEHIALLSQGGLDNCANTLAILEETTGPELYIEFPEALQQLRAVQVAQLLQKVLNAGIFDELGWPALEAAVAELRGTGKTPADVELSGAYPWLVVHNFKRAVVIDACGPVFRHDLQLPKGGRLFGMRYACGQLLVVYRNYDYQGKAYWTGQPGDVLNVEDVRSWRWVRTPGVSLADGRFCQGGRALQPGQAGNGNGHAMLSDGQQFWVWDDGRRTSERQGPAGWCALNPDTGAKGEQNTPPWLGITLAGGYRWGDHAKQRLLPAPTGVTQSPLGVQGGLVGLRTWESSGPSAESGEMAQLVAEGIDGRRWQGRVAGDIPDALLRYPGSVQVVAAIGDSKVELWHGAGRDDEPVQIQHVEVDDSGRPAGTPLPPPLAFWHMLQVRDEQGSLALRTLDLAAVQTLLDAGVAAAQQPHAKKDNESAVLPLAAVCELVPTVTHAALRAGVAQQVAKAADLQVRLNELTALATGAR